jgi:hypothetical protein
LYRMDADNFALLGRSSRVTNWGIRWYQSIN